MNVTILVVEDDVYLQEAMQLLLETSLPNYEVTVLTANNGSEALHLVEQNLPNLIISDISMPIFEWI